MSTLVLLSEIVRAEGEPLAGALRAAPEGAPVAGPLAAAGPRAASDPQAYELLVEAIYEGYLLHYGRSRLLDDSDPNLALLAGDRLYALGLERLVALGDLEAVGELADVISLCALAQARGLPELCPGLWLAGARAVGYGASAEHAKVKALLREGSSQAVPALAALVAFA
ncbi:MAG: hypothetical protein ABSC56_06915 [Solirubrobacteraceae bacterium]